MPETEIKVQNMVASAFLDTDIDLENLVKKVPDIEYKPEEFPGAVFRLTKPKRTALIFNSGKIVCTGSKTIDQVEDAIEIITRILKKAGVEIEGEPRIKIQNIVASLNFEQSLNLNNIAYSCPMTEYEPEQFPGLVYRMDLPETKSGRAVFLLFGSGKVVCTGTRREKDIEVAVKKLKKKLKELEEL